MFTTFTFALEIVICFVLVDFVLGHHHGSVILALGCGLILLSVVTSGKSARSVSLGKMNDVKGKKSEMKQGAYGKVTVHKQSLLQQLLQPLEVWAMFRYKMGAISISGGGLGDGLETFALVHDDVEFCSIKLKQVSRSFATVITFLPNEPDAPLRLAVAVFYLVLRALDTVEDDMDLNLFDPFVLEQDKKGFEDARLVAKQRLLRDFAIRMEDSIAGNPGKHQSLHGLGQGAERELVEDLGKLVRVMGALPKELQRVILAITLEMGCGMADYIARDLKNGTDDEEDFESYCHIAAGTVGDGLTQLFAACGFCPSGLVMQRDLWDSMGSFLQRTNIIRDYLEDLVDGRAWWPRSVWEEYVPADEEFGHPLSLSRLAESTSMETGKSLSCLNHLVADALGLVDNCLEYLAQFDDVRVLSFCALPQVMAIATLAECFNNPKLFQGVVKIRKGQAAHIMLDLSPTEHPSAASLHLKYLDWFEKCTKIIQSKARKASRMDPQAQRADHVCGQIIKTLQTRIQFLRD